MSHECIQDSIKCLLLFFASFPWEILKKRRWSWSSDYNLKADFPKKIKALFCGMATNWISNRTNCIPSILTRVLRGLPQRSALIFFGKDISAFWLYSELQRHFSRISQGKEGENQKLIFDTVLYTLTWYVIEKGQIVITKVEVLPTSSAHKRLQVI